MAQNITYSRFLSFSLYLCLTNTVSSCTYHALKPSRTPKKYQPDLFNYIMVFASPDENINPVLREGPSPVGGITRPRQTGQWQIHLKGGL